MERFNRGKHPDPQIMSGHDSRLSRFLRQTAILFWVFSTLAQLRLMIISKEMQPESRF